MKNSTLSTLRNACTLEAVVTLNYYACKERKLEDATKTALTDLAKTKATLELLGLYTDYSLTCAIEVYNALSEDDKTAFRQNYGYSFSFNFYYIEDMIRRLQAKEIGVIDITLG